MYSPPVPTPRGAERIVVLVAALAVLLFAARAVLLLRHPYTVEYGEGTTWTYARLFETRGGYFLPIDREPWIHGTYPPVFPGLQALLGGGLFHGRLIGLAGTLLAALSLASVLSSSGLRRGRAGFWACIFLAAPAVHEWAALCRVDTLALGLSLLGVAIVSRGATREGGRPELLAAPFFALALLTKQVALAAPFAVGLWLLVRGEWRRAGLFALVLGALAGTPVALLDWRSGGEMYRHLVTYTGFVGLAAGPLARWALRLAFTFPVLLSLGLRGLGPSVRTPAGIYALVAMATVLGSGKPGAAANYLLEPSAGVILAGALAFERRKLALAGAAEARVYFDLLLAVQVLILCGPGRLTEPLDLWRGGEAEARVVERLRVAPGPVLAEDLGLVLAAGKEPLLEPFQFGLLARAGLFDPAPVLAEVEARRFAVIVTGWRLLGVPGLEAALARSYARSEDVGPYAVWLPGEGTGAAP